MNFAVLSKEELLVVLVAFKNLNKRNIAVLNTDLYKLPNEDQDRNFAKFLVGIKSLFDKNYNEIDPSHHADRLVYFYEVDADKRSIRVAFSQNIRIIYNGLKKSTDNIGLTYLDFNHQYSKVLFGLALPALKDRLNCLTIDVSDFTKHLSQVLDFNLRKALLRACNEINKKTSFRLTHDVIGDLIKLQIRYPIPRKSKNKLRDLNTFDMFNGMTETDISEYMQNILKDQYFYLLYSFENESRHEFSNRIKTIITSNQFPELMKDFKAAQSIEI